MFYTDLIVIVVAMLSRALYVRAKNGFQVHVDSLRANHEGVGPDRAMEVLSEHRPANLVTST